MEATALSDVYDWSGDYQLHYAYKCDARGRFVPHNFITTADKYGVRTKVKLAKDESAVVKKVPLVLETDKPVNLIVTKYDRDCINLTLNGQGRVSLKVS